MTNMDHAIVSRFRSATATLHPHQLGLSLAPNSSRARSCTGFREPARHRAPHTPSSTDTNTLQCSVGPRSLIPAHRRSIRWPKTPSCSATSGISKMSCPRSPSRIREARKAGKRNRPWADCLAFAPEPITRICLVCRGTYRG